MIASVYVDIDSVVTDMTYDYLVPEGLANHIECGMRVIVPFGSQKRMAFVVELKEESQISKLKNISSISDAYPCLSKELLDLGLKLSKYYFAGVAQTFKAMIPQALLTKYVKKYVIINDDLPAELLDVASRGVILESKLKGDLKKIAVRAVRKGTLRVAVELVKQSSIKTVKTISANPDYAQALPMQQQELLNYLISAGGFIDKIKFSEYFSVSYARINLLVKKGAIIESSREVIREYDNIDYQDKVVTLNAEQENVCKALQEQYGSFKTFLLHGVTGSGKTEIYLRIAEDMLRLGKQVIVLAPEIALTHQLVSRFKGRFSDKVAVWHSGLSMGEKYDCFRQIKENNVQIVIGARSACFSPMNNLGAIIIDEEHDGGFIQDNNPMYDARLVARMRAKTHGAIVVLGSATPDIISYSKVITGEYQLLSLKNRVNDVPLPVVDLVDMNEEILRGNKTTVSLLLQEEIKHCLEDSLQAMVLINRRGYANFMQCGQCNAVLMCPHCSVSLTYHLKHDVLKCHYCGKVFQIDTCPRCESKDLRKSEGGTERIATELQEMFPAARVLRMDHDSTQLKHSHEEILDEFREGKADILVGTQMIAKGLDFPNVRVVGILNAEKSLYYPSFDANFTTFSLVTQVAGRAGRRDFPGRVIVQSSDVKHYAITSACNHNYENFYAQELFYRKYGNYPPYTKMIEIKISGRDQYAVYSMALSVAEFLKARSKLHVFDPIEDHVLRVDDDYRYVLLIKYLKESEVDMINEVVNIARKEKFYVSITRL